MLTISLALLFAVSAVCAADNSTDDIAGIEQTENSCDEILSVETDNHLIGVDEGTFGDLTNEINAVGEGDSVNLTRDYKYVNGSTEGIKINKSITINGNGHKIDGNKQSRIFATFDGNIILKNITLVNGHADKGGAIFVNKTITCIGVVFENNVAEEGGAIYTMANLTLDNCVFDGGYAKNGAAIYAHSISPTGQGTVDDMNMTPEDDPDDDIDPESNETDDDSFPDGPDDSDIDPYNESPDFPKPVEHIDDNETDFKFDELTGPFNIIIANSMFKNFKDIPLALIVLGDNDCVRIINTTFANSTSLYSTVIFTQYFANQELINNTFVNLHAKKSGGAIGIATVLSLRILNCSFDNVTASDNAGVINADGQGWMNGAKAEILINNTEFKNSRSKYGAVIASYGAGMIIDNSSFTDNCAESNAIIYATQGRLKITNSKFKNNKINSTDDNQLNRALLYLFKINVKIDNCQFMDNSNEIFALNVKYNITNNVFNNNGRAIYSIASGFYVLQGNEFNGREVVENASDKGFYVTIVNSTGVALNLIENSIDVSNLPSRFDSRDWGWVTVPKDQWISGACWVFSTCAALETALLKSTGVEYNISVNNIHKNMLQYAMYGSDWLVEPGLTYMAANFMLSWYAALPVEYGEFDMISKVIEPIISSDAIHIHDIIWLGPRGNSTDNDALKRVIMKYGAVTTGMYADYDSIYFNRNTSAHYFNETGGHSSHAVCIVGWDDNYPASNFRITPPGNGAWIVKNSYGPDSYDHGYIYISYYDTLVNNDSFEVAFVFENTEQYTKNYQTDIAGDVAIKNMSGNYSYKNTYTAVEDDFISAVGTYFDHLGEDYTVRIYVNDVLKHTQTGLAPFMGYHTIKLTDYVPVRAGDTFTILMQTHSMPLVIKSGMPFSANVSFGNNGTGWVDLASIEATVSLKAYTKPLINLNTLIGANDVNTVYNGGKYLTVTVKDVFGDAVKGATVEVTLSNGKKYSAQSDAKGQVRFLTNGLVPKTYSATITTSAFGNYLKTTSTAKIVVKKATPKFKAKNKKFKKATKVKKYTVTLKDNVGKAMKKVKVTIKIGKKTYKAKTNAKGKATFKIKKLTKKGKYKATLTYKGNACYNKATKKVKITVK